MMKPFTLSVSSGNVATVSQLAAKDGAFALDVDWRRKASKKDIKESDAFLARLFGLEAPTMTVKVNDPAERAALALRFVSDQQGRA